MIKVSQSYIIYVYTHKATHSRAASVAEPSQQCLKVAMCHFLKALQSIFVY